MTLPTEGFDIQAALTRPELIFGLKVVNVGSINLRHQYALDRRFALSDNLDQTIHNWRHHQGLLGSVEFGSPDDYFTYVIRTTIVAIEGNLVGAVKEELGFSNRFSNEFSAKLKNPMRMGRGGTAEAYYNSVPGLLDERIRLKCAKPDLWKTVARFYSEVRNPLFHGHQLIEIKAEPLRKTFAMVDEIFGWMDEWSDPNRILRIISNSVFHEIPNPLTKE